MSDIGNNDEHSSAPHSPSRIVKGPQDTVSTEDSLEQKISLRMEIMLKKEKLRQEEEANYTYKPKIYTANKGKGQSEDPNQRENRFDKLYGDALKRHITTNIKEDQKDKDLTFTPKITKRASSRSGSNSRSASRERSATPDTASSTPRSRKSLEPEKPSFQPAITKRAKSIERARDKEVSDRLYEHGQHVKEKLERKKVEADQKQLESCTFQPKIDTKRSSSASKLDVVSRMSKFEENRQKKLQEAVNQKKENERGFSFQPTLFAKRSSTPTQQQQPFHERLSIQPEKNVSHAAAEAMAQLTFHPQIVSKRAPSPNSRTLNEYKSVHERLYHEGEERRILAENEIQMRRHELDSELTFHPQILSPGTSHSPEPVFERLSMGAERWEVKQKLERIKMDLSKDWTFQPTISENSKKLVRREPSAHNMYERQMNEVRRLQEELEKKKEEKTQEQLREATFAPNIPQSSKSLAKKKLSSHSIDTTSDVYSRLTSPSAAAGEGNGFASTSNHNIQVPPDQQKRSLLLPEKVLTQVFTRLATPTVQQMEENAAKAEEPKKIVLPEKEVDQIFNRLNVTRTMSFTFKYDPDVHDKQAPNAPNSPPASERKGTSANDFLNRSAVKDSGSVASSTDTPAKAAQPTPSKTRTPSASRVTPAKKSAAPSTAKKEPAKNKTVLPSPPPVVRGSHSQASPMPPAPPTTTVKGQPKGQPDYYDDLAKKLEASLSLINQSTTPAQAAPVDVQPPRAPEPEDEKQKSTKKEGEEFINSIPVVNGGDDNGTTLSE